MMKYSVIQYILGLILISTTIIVVNAEENRIYSSVWSADIMEADTAYLAAGCFWCTQAIFDRVKGVKEVISGYSGGETKNPTYQQISTGQTGHTETLRIVYDAEVITYGELVRLFFGAHDPTQLNRQGPDIGTQYRSAIFYTSVEQKRSATKVMKELNLKEYNGKIVTEISPFKTFYEAENYHQGFYDANPDNPYIKNVSEPEVKKFEIRFPDYIK